MRKAFITTGAQVQNKLVDKTYKYDRYIVRSVDENGDGIAYGIVAVDEKGDLLLDTESVKITEKNAVRFRYLKNDEARQTPVEDGLKIVDGVIMYNGQPASKAGQGNIVAKSLLGVLPGVVVFTAEQGDQRAVYTLDIERDAFKNICFLTKDSEVEVVNSDENSLAFISKAKEHHEITKEDGTVEKAWDELIDARYFLLSAEDGRHVRSTRLFIPGYPTKVNRFGEILAIEYQVDTGLKDDYDEDYEDEDLDSFEPSEHVISEENKNTMILALGAKGYRVLKTLLVGDVTSYAYANGYITFAAGGQIYVNGPVNATLPGYISVSVEGFTAIDSSVKDNETSIFFVKDDNVKTVARTATADRGDLYKVV